MKIGIITFWHTTDNYGQVLQAFALQKFLINEGHTPFLIRYDFMHRIIRRPFWKRILKTVLLYNYFSNKKELEQKIERLNSLNEQRKFDEFRKLNLEQSNNIYLSLDELRSNPPVADCYIVGSDQVWAQLLSLDENRVFFLDFGEKRVKRLSYAASFAMKTYPAYLSRKLKEQLSKFDGISVREKDGVDICKNIGVDAQHVLDPTFLINRNAYMSFVKQNDESFLYIYSLNITNAEEMRWYDIKDYAEKNNMAIRITPSSGYVLADCLFGDDVHYDYATIQGWLSNIYNSNMFITTSFHGVAFALILQKKFVYVPLKGNYSVGNNRVLELLNDLGLSDNILDENTSVERYFNCKIDWVDVQRRLSIKWDLSVSFLHAYLNN